MEDVQKICIDFDFEEDKIDEYLKFFEVEAKYKGIPAYEWHETKTKEQKTQERRRKLLEAERLRRKEKRMEEFNVEKERRRVEWQAKQDERKKRWDAK